jgi:hypothetical protein
LHKGIEFLPKLKITNSINCIGRIHFKNQKDSEFQLSIIARMFSLSKVVEDELQSFIELMFSSFKALRRSRFENETTL